MTPLLRILNLGRSFDGKDVFQKISFEAGAGDRVALIGRNGSGKTTLLRILSTIILPSSGDAWIGEYSVLRDAARIRRLIAWVPAMDGGFFTRLNGLENLFLFGAMRGIGKKQVMEFLDRWRDFAVFQSAIGTRFGLCSTGMKQILHLMRALLAEPRLLLLDEPTRSLDFESASIVRAILKDISEECLVVFSTHNSEEMNELATKRFFLGDIAGETQNAALPLSSLRQKSR